MLTNVHITGGGGHIVRLGSSSPSPKTGSAAAATHQEYALGNPDGPRHIKNIIKNSSMEHSGAYTYTYIYIISLYTQLWKMASQKKIRRYGWAMYFDDLRIKTCHVLDR